MIAAPIQLPTPAEVAEFRLLWWDGTPEEQAQRDAYCAAQEAAEAELQAYLRERDAELESEEEPGLEFFDQA